MDTEPSGKLRIEYIKSNLFRVVHVDGAIGGTTPRLELFINFYSERFPIPRVLTYEMSPEGAPAREIIEDRESKEGIIRESEVGLILDLAVATSLLQWLGEKVTELEKNRNQISQITQKGRES